jgi:1,5-anhydro-D-fructose reductase (1,5-anhydro-D-mannitol-forming)
MLRIGVIGTGSISENNLTPAIAEVEGAELWSILSRDKNRAEAFAREQGAKSSEPGFTSLDRFLSDPKLDAVIIASPDGLHAEQTIAAAQAGKHVFVEKPMATSIEEADAMIEACFSAGVRLGIAYHMRWHLGHRKLAKSIKEGGFGDIHHARAQMTFKAFDARNWRASYDVGRWWSLAGVGTHCLDWIRWMLVPVCGEVCEVGSIISSGILGSSRDETASINLKFESGATAQLLSSVLFSAPSRGEIYGSDGHAFCEDTFGRHGGGVIKSSKGEISFRQVNPYAGEIEDFVTSVIENRDPEVSGTEGRRNTELLSNISPI